MSGAAQLSRRRALPCCVLRCAAQAWSQPVVPTPLSAQHTQHARHAQQQNERAFADGMTATGSIMLCAAQDVMSGFLRRSL